MPTHSIIFAGGGTGGHIFPALAIAQACTLAHAGANNGSALHCEFVVSQRPLDTAILQAQTLAGAPAVFTPIPAQPASLRPAGLYKFITQWGAAVRASRHILQRCKQQGPVVVVATGGFVAAPVAQAARVERVPLVMVNLDAIPGKANRWIGKRATVKLTALAVAPHIKLANADAWITTRPIVRANITNTADTRAARAHFGLRPDKPTLFITGGSQGAGSINDCMQHAVSIDGASAFAGWQVLHQAGNKANLTALQDAYGGANIPAHVCAFIDRIDLAWAAADLAICRSGAGNVSEVWATHTPAIFLPYPYHKDEHQRWNAMPLQSASASIIVKDHIDPKKTYSQLQAPLTTLLTTPAARSAMRDKLLALGEADGAQTIAHHALRLLNS